MRLLCPNCQKVVTVADGEAGKPVTCAACGKPFQAPSLFVPAVDQSSPTRLAAVAEPLQPPPMPETASSGRPPSMADMPGNFRSFTVKPEYLLWIVRVCVLLPLPLGFFAWVHSAPGGHSAYSQNGWQCLFAGLSIDPVAEETLGWAKGFNANLGSCIWLLPYGLALFLAAVLVWTDFLMPQWKPALPLPVQRLWDARRPAVGVLVLFAFLCFGFQSLLGLGLPRAALKTAAATHAEQAISTPEKIAKAEMLVGKDYGAYCIGKTWSHTVLILCLLSLVLAVAGLFLLERRGTKPALKVGAVW